MRASGLMRLLWPLGAVGLAAAARQRFAAVDLDNELIPRYWVDPAFPILKRAGICTGENQHPCEDIGFPDICCPDSSYCFVNKNFEAKCCPIGSNCVSDSICKSDAYYCTISVTASSSTSTQTGCCPRKCPATSNYLCAQSLGGNCCPYGQDCVESGGCRTTASESATALLTPIQEGCTTSQYKCDDGKGCCDNNQICTDVSGEGYCAPGIPTQTNIEYIGSDPSADKLSDGAKAGIAVGAVVVAGIIIGLVTWFCIRKRKERRALTEPSEGQQTEDPTQVGSMAEPTPYERGTGLTQDYFGPHPVAGPFTEEDISPGSSPHLHRAVPTVPQQPGDIAAPVEIDGRSTVDDGRSTTHNSVVGTPGPKMESIQGRFELYGSEHVPHEGPPSIVPTPVEMKNGYFEQKPPDK